MNPWKRFFIAVPIALAASVLALVIRGYAAPTITPLPDPPMPSPNAFDEFALAYINFHDLDMFNDLDNGRPNRTSLQYIIDKLGVTESTHLITENQTGLALLRRGIGEAYCAPPQHTFDAVYPYLPNDRAMVRVLAFDARLKERNGDWSGSMDDSLDILQMGNQVSSRGLLIIHLVGVAFGQIGRPTAWADSQKLSRKEAMAAERRMETIMSQRASLTMAMRYDQDWCETGAVDAFRNNESFKDANAAQQSQSFALYEKYMADAIAISKLPYQQARTVDSPPIPSDPLCALICPVYSELIFKDTQVLTFDRLLTTSLALRTYSLDHKGAYPQTLSQLTPTYMTQIPVDPFALTRASMVYRKTEDAYLLYSVGPDGHDDGGQPCVGHLSGGDTSLRTYYDTDTGDVVAGINNG